MSLDSFNAAALLRELEPLLERARLQKFSQLTEHDFLLHFRCPGITHKVLISLHPDKSRFHLLESGHPPAIVPSAFVMLCRKHVGGTWLTGVEQLNLDRRLEFRFNSGFSLAFDWAGRPSSLVLLKTEERKVVGLLPPRGRIDRREPYQFPADGLPSPLELSPEEAFSGLQALDSEYPLSKALSQVTSSWSPLWRKRFCRFTEADRVDNCSESRFEMAWNRIVAPLMPDGPPIKAAIDSDQGLTYCGDESQFESLHSAANTKWLDSNLAPGVSDDKTELLKKLKKSRDKATRKLNKRKQDRAGALTAPKDQLRGDLLLAYAHNVKRGSKEFATHDWEGNPVTIPLDPRMNVHDNANRFYNKAKKKRRALDVLDKQIGLAQEEIEQWDELIFSAETSENRTDLEQVRKSMPTNSQGRKKKRLPQVPSSGPRRFRHQDFLILVGRNPAQNDKLSLKTASKEDLWFHVRQGAGSHVLVRTLGKEAPPATIEAAAWLAAKYSQSGDSTSVGVVTTRARFLKKPKGGPLGKVIYRQETEIMANPSEPKPEGLERETKNGRSA